MISKKRKLVLLTSIMTAFAVATVALFSSGSLSSPLKVGGSTELVEGSITWNATNSEKTIHSGSRVSYLRRTARGTSIYAYSNGQYDVSDNYILDSKGSDYLKYGIFISSEAGTNSSLFQFQNITSINVTTAAGSTAGATFKVYTDKDAEGVVAYTGTASPEEETFSISTEVFGAKYLAIRPGNIQEILIKSVTINYTCDPSVSPEPKVDTYDISYVGLDGWSSVPLYGIDPTGLPASADEESTVEFNVVALTDYEFLGAFEFDGDTITDLVSNGNHVSFTMPSNNVTICLQVQSTVVTLSSITLDTTSVQKEFSVGDTFSYAGLVVTAHYSDSSSATVTPTSISSPDMSTAGEKTVTVSYTEDEITKTQTYSISVASAIIPVTLNDTYQFASRAGSGTSYSAMTITFTSAGKATWHNERSNYLGNYVCDMYFVYTAEDDGVSIKIKMSIDDTREPHHSGYYGYYFTLNGEEKNSESAWSGGGYDRPIDGKFTEPFKNNSGVMKRDKSSFTIDVYDKNHSYEVYDTFTFNLQQ